MKEIKHYVCDVCGTEYRDKAACLDCEKGHIIPLAIDAATFVSIRNNGSGYPTKVHIKMKNGEIITYKR